MLIVCNIHFIFEFPLILFMLHNQWNKKELFLYSFFKNYNLLPALYNFHTEQLSSRKENL